MRKVLYESGFYVGREGKSICCQSKNKAMLCSECRAGYNHDHPNDPIPSPLLSTSRVSNYPPLRLPPHPNQTGLSCGTYRAIDGTIRCSDCHGIHTSSSSTHSYKGTQPMRNAASVKTNLSDIEVRTLIELALKDVEPSANLVSIWQGKGEILYTLNGDHYTRSFTIKDDISIVFGNPVQVVEEKTYVPVTASVAARVSNSPVTNRSTRPLPDTWAMSAAEHDRKKDK